MKDFNLNKIIEELGKERMIYNSEADFQFALAWKIKEQYEDINVFLEYYFDTQENEKKKKMYVDLMLEKDEHYIPIELKYRKKKLKTPYKDCYSNQSLSLTNQNAQDQGRYWFLYDVHRIEKIKEILVDKFEKGYAVFLTNDKSYKTGPTRETKCFNFRISNDRVIKKGKLEWSENTAKSSIGNGNFSLNNEYILKWNTCSKLDGYEDDEARVFEYLILPIN